VIRDVAGIPTYDEQINQQVASARQQKGAGDLQALFHAGETWEVA
jgi:2-oxoglutarate ferredoxin oxidoreductase subunit beta